MASIVGKLLGLGAGYGRQAISRVLPASEERILGNLERGAKDMLQRAAQKNTGFTFDPRRGKFLEPGKQSGSMMASVPNLPGQSSGAGTVRSIDELISTAKRPEVMSRLQRGEYLGGWNPEGGGVGLDPSRRFLTEFGALRSGLKTNQMGGFSLLRQRGYDVTPGELSSARNRLAAGTAGALAAGTAGALAVPGENPVKNFLEGLKGNKEQSDAATFTGRLARESLFAGALPVERIGAPLLGIMALPKLNKLAKLGVAVGEEGRDAAIVARNRAKAVGVPEEDLNTILDTDGEKVAFAKAYEITKKHNGQMFNKRSVEDLEIERAKIVNNPGTIAASPTKEFINNLASKMPEKPNTVALKSYEKLKDSVISPELADAGVRPVRKAASGEDMAILAKAGKFGELVEAQTGFQSNILRYVTQADLDDIAARNGVPIFYNLHSLATRARAAALDIPLVRFLASQGPASAKAGPMTEVTRGLAALFQKPISERALTVAREAKPDSKKLSKVILDANKASNKARDAEIASGSLINIVRPGQLQGDIASPARALAAVEDDLVQFLKVPTSVPGIAEKVYIYLGTTASPLQKISAVMDSWMQRAGFGNINLSTITPGNTLAYQLVHEAFVDLARQLGVPPAALQEVVWKNIRFMARENADSFAGLWDDAFLDPFISKNAKIRQIGTPNVLDMAKDIKAQNESFADKLIKAVQTNPEIAKYIEIVGQDVQFTDEFFKLVNLFS